MAEMARLIVGSNMCVHQPEFTVLFLYETIGNVDAMPADGFNLRAHQNETSVIGIKDMIIATRFAVFGDNLAPVLHFCRPGGE